MLDVYFAELKQETIIQQPAYEILDLLSEYYVDSSTVSTHFPRSHVSYFLMS